MEETHIGPVLVASVLETRVDARTGVNLRAAISRRFDEGHHRILLDLSGVSFVDSTGLGAIVAALKHMGQSGELALCGATEAVSVLFRLTRLDKVFRMFPTRDAALAALVQA